VKCLVDGRHKGVFESILWDGELREIRVVACPVCRLVWYAE